MKQIILMIAVVALVGCGTTQTPTNWNWVSDPSDPNNFKVVKAIHRYFLVHDKINKPTGELTKADLEKVTYLGFYDNWLTEVFIFTFNHVR